MTTSNNLDKNSPIAFVDSGVGGLTVFSKVKKILPYENYLYYGDTLHMPYGEKTKEQLLEYSGDIFSFFESKNAKAVVMACNTTSSVIYDRVKNKYNFKIFPIVQSVAQILAQLPVKRLGIFATRATIASGVYQNEIAQYNPDMLVFVRHCPDWVPIVEENTANTPESKAIIKSDLDIMLKNNPEKIVLGCTHYPFLTDILSEFASRDMFIDPAIHFAKYIQSGLAGANLLKEDITAGFEEFYVSSDPQNFQNASKMFYDVKQLPQLLQFGKVLR